MLFTRECKLYPENCNSVKICKISLLLLPGLYLKRPTAQISQKHIPSSREISSQSHVGILLLKSAYRILHAQIKSISAIRASLHSYGWSSRACVDFNMINTSKSVQWFGRSIMQWSVYIGAWLPFFDSPPTTAECQVGQSQVVVNRKDFWDDLCDWSILFSLLLGVSWIYGKGFSVKTFLVTYLATIVILVIFRNASSLKVKRNT